jgi:hypothetical protein
MAKIPKGSDVGVRMNLWYRRCNFSNPMLKNWSNTWDFPESCVEFHKLSNEYKLVKKRSLEQRDTGKIRKGIRQHKMISRYIK